MSDESTNALSGWADDLGDDPFGEPIADLTPAVRSDVPAPIIDDPWSGFGETLADARPRPVRRRKLRDTVRPSATWALVISAVAMISALMAARVGLDLMAGTPGAMAAFILAALIGPAVFAGALATMGWTFPPLSLVVIAVISGIAAISGALAWPALGAVIALVIITAPVLVLAVAGTMYAESA